MDEQFNTRVVSKGAAKALDQAFYILALLERTYKAKPERPSAVIVRWRQTEVWLKIERQR
jgi:hypothetical protein